MTETILARFAEVSAHPRRSKHEARLRRWLQAWAQQHGFSSRTDATGNLVIAVPASPGAETAPTVVIQGHMDMVCEKVQGSAHDFSQDPILPVRDGDWLTAPDTSLGADNGIAIAMAMVLATSDVAHPPLELLFTIDEETSMTGAIGLDPALITGRTLVNIDSEDEGVLTVGCAGGVETQLRVPLETECAPAGMVAARLVATGMTGGHSGVDIHHQRANAIRVLVRALDLLVAEQPALRLVDLRGGTAHNAIPRHAQADLLLPAGALSALADRLAAFETAARAEFSHSDPGLALRLESLEGSDTRPWSPESTRRALDLLLTMPHGVAAMSADVDGLVETSNNEAQVSREGDDLVVLSSQRSNVPSRLVALTRRIESLGRLAGAAPHTGDGYPPWPPDMDSPLLARCRRIYKARFGKEPVVEIIHAGLECGLIGDRIPDMDMISLGPTIRSPHSPDERLLIPTVGMVWDFLVAIMAELAAER
ncbi:MAG: aminoacyl-histidine dipeptidase [Oligoflexia bacterium]|nr:aminoacyl-histidine dipeptidase [Oligoflexia bacterium]